MMRMCSNKKEIIHLSLCISARHNEISIVALCLQIAYLVGLIRKKNYTIHLIG